MAQQKGKEMYIKHTYTNEDKLFTAVCLAAELKAKLNPVIYSDEYSLVDQFQECVMEYMKSMMNLKEEDEEKGGEKTE